MPKINNETDLEYKRRVIDIKSASFCAAKWYNATIWLGSGMTTSCHHPLPHKVQVSEIELNPRALHNTVKKKQERAEMQQGIRPKGCEYCWKIEDMGTDAISDRVYKTVIYTDEELEDAFNTPEHADVNLRTLEIAFDRVCQFACSYCNPAFSTAWARDIRSQGPYNNLVSDGRNHFTHAHDSSQLFALNEVNPYVEAFFKWWESDLHKTLTELRITGGEPLMSGHTQRLLDWFKANRGQSTTRLAINSNLGYNQSVLENLLEQTEGIELDIYTSNESFGRHAEYIRDGLDWVEWCSNLDYLINSKRLRGIHVMCTINALCLFSLSDFLWKLIELKKQHGRDIVSFTLNILRFPSFQSPLVLPKEFVLPVIDQLTHIRLSMKETGLLHDHEVSHINRLIDYLQNVDSPHTGAADIDTLRHDFKQFYQQYDERRGKNFVETFPLLEEWYNNL